VVKGWDGGGGVGAGRVDERRGVRGGEEEREVAGEEEGEVAGEEEIGGVGLITCVEV
jgi:hypothetical protein